MIDLVDLVRRGVGRKDEAASASGSLNARLAELLARITTTLVGRIDVAVSSRIQASAYTSARAAKLDQIGVVSVQRGETTMSAASNTDVSITSVNTAKTLFAYGGSRSTEATNDRLSRRAKSFLLNSTTVRHHQVYTSTAIINTWNLIEFR